MNVGHLIIYLLPEGETNWAAVSLVLIGVSYSLLVAALWSSIPYIVPANAVGTAYGITYMIQNMFLALFPWICGHFVPKKGNNDVSKLKYLSLVMICCALIGTLMSLFLYSYDIRHTGILFSRSPKSIFFNIEY